MFDIAEESKGNSWIWLWDCPAKRVKIYNIYVYSDKILCVF